MRFTGEFGMTQAYTRSVSRRRLLLPAVLLTLSLMGVTSAFGSSPAELGIWLLAVVVLPLLNLSLKLPKGARVSEANPDKIVVPGSWVPLALMMGLFAIKYFVGYSMALHPELASDSSFATAVTLGYGLFSGAFLARSIHILGSAGSKAAQPAPGAVS